jgi:hypothetical protein
VGDYFTVSGKLLLKFYTEVGRTGFTETLETTCPNAVCHNSISPQYEVRFMMYSMITNIYTKKTKGPTLMELFTATRKPKQFFTTRDVRCVHYG